MKDKKCVDCGQLYLPTGRAAKYCKICSQNRAKTSSRKRTQNYRILHGLIQKPYVGKGGNNASGETDSQYICGSVFFQKRRKEILAERKQCERCSKLLFPPQRYMWVVHHRDHDRSNNSEENFELLCKRCHQLEHNCFSHFPDNEQRLGESRRTQEGSKRTGPPKRS